APVAAGLIGIADVLQRLLVADPLVLRPDLVELHGEECQAAITVMLDGRVVDAQKAARLGIEHPHRHRIIVEQQSKGGLTPLQGRDVGYRQRENVTERSCAQLQAALVAVDFKLVAPATPDDLEQPLDYVLGAQKISPRAKPVPQ